MKMTRFPKKSLFSLVVLSLLAPTFAFAMGSGDKFVDAQTGRTYGIYKPSNTLNLKLHTFQSLLCTAGKEQWVAVSYGTGKKKLDIYETMAGDKCSDPGLSKTLASTTINGARAVVHVYCDPMNAQAFKACGTKDIARVGGFLMFTTKAKKNLKATEIQVQGIGGITYQELIAVAKALK
ncbi:MAG: hypothetical protein F2787_04920 [Actinobacteria bacterium]|uniref:Unannotated protein n=1 Tax=freshwater metagenome TaxID=449393 RepID=A0A6J7DPN5_9ZZZZ|nr:hypothetical protein [Actinomycetota bacterium]